MTTRPISQFFSSLHETFYAISATPIIIFAASLLFIFKGQGFFEPNLTNGILPSAFLALYGFYLANLYSLQLKDKDYKINRQFQTICFAMGFLTLILLLNGWQHGNLVGMMFYIYMILFAMPAFYIYSLRSVNTINTGNLLLMIFTSSLLTLCIPASIHHLLIALGLIFKFALKADFALTFDKSSFAAISFLVPMIFLYIATPLYMKEQQLHKKHRELFSSFTQMIQFLLLPLYFVILGICEIHLEPDSSHGLTKLRLLVMLIAPLIIINIFSINRRKNDWLDNSNLNAQHLLSPFSLMAILIYLKAPYLSDIVVSGQDYFHSFPLLHLFYAQILIFFDIINITLIQDFLPQNLLNFLILTPSDSRNLFPLIAIISHILLLVANFWILNRILPNLYIFIILLLVPIEFLELLVIIGYMALLFDRNFRSNSPIKWCHSWFFGGILFLLLVPLYATFFILGTLPFVIYHLRHIAQKQPETIRNNLLIYGFCVIFILLAPISRWFVIMVKDIVAEHWFATNLSAGDSGSSFLQLDILELLWLPVLLFIFAVSALNFKKLARLNESHYYFDGWVGVSCALTILYSVPILLHSLTGLNDDINIKILFYIVVLLFIPLTLFYHRVPFGKFLPYLGCGAALLLGSYYSHFEIPTFEQLFFYSS